MVAAGPGGETTRCTDTTHLDYLVVDDGGSATGRLASLWRALKQYVAANRQAPSIDALVAEAAKRVLYLTPTKVRRKAGMVAALLAPQPVT